VRQGRLVSIRHRGHCARILGEWQPSITTNACFRLKTAAQKIEPGPEVPRRAAGASRKLAAGAAATIVNGQVLLKDDEHTDALPGRVMGNTYYRANNNA